MAYKDETNNRLKEMCEQRGLPTSGAKAMLVARLEEDDRRKYKRELAQDDNRVDDDSHATKKLMVSKECSNCNDYCPSSFFRSVLHQGINKTELEKHKQMCLICCGKWILAKLNDHLSPENIICPVQDCETRLKEADAHRMLALRPDVLQIYQAKPIWIYLAELPNFRVCEQDGCNEMTLIESMDGSSCNTWKCPNDHLNCFQCRTVHGEQETCKEFQVTHDITSFANQEARILQSLISKPCPKCGVYIERSGCHKIKCPMCKNSYCFECDKAANGKLGYRNMGHAEGCKIFRSVSRCKGKQRME